MDRCVAVLGTGGIGMRHLAILNGIDGVTTIAIPKRPGRAEELSKQGQTSAISLAEAQTMGANTVVIATDTGQHFGGGMAAIDAGMHILLEKPLTTNALDAKSLRDHANKNNRQLHVACVLRFSKSLNIFRTLLPQISKIHSVRIECQSYLPEWRPDRSYLDSFRARPGEGGVLLDLIHEIDYAGWLYGWPDSLRGSVKNLGQLGIEADEIAEMQWSGSDGHGVSVAVDFLTRPTHRRMNAYGEQGSIEWNGTEGTVTLQLVGEEPSIKKAEQNSEQMLTAQTIAFLEAVSGNVDPRLATADDGVRALGICDAARQSSDSGQTEMVAQP